MYVGFILLLLPLLISAGPLSLSVDPSFFGFEDGLDSVDSITGNPKVVTSLFVSGNMAVECKNGDYLRWNLAIPSKTLDLTFKVYWTRLPIFANQSFIIGEIWGLDKEMWQDIFSTTLYCDLNGYKGWSLWSGVPSGRSSFIWSNVVETLEINRWYTIRITADLNIGTYEIHMNGDLLASISGIFVPEDVYVDFFRLGAGVRGEDIFTIYYDDVSVSLLGPMPSPQQWSVRVGASLGGSTYPNGTINVNNDQTLTVTATKTIGYVFSMWTLDGVEYSTNSTVTIPVQSIGSRHKLYATFTSINPQPTLELNWFLFQLLGLSLVVSSGYVLWSQAKQKVNNING